MSGSCGICIEDFNRTTHKSIPCNSCDFTACKACVEHYISDNITTTHCMSCRAEWNRAHVVKIFTKSYCDTTYKKHRENVLLDRERGLLPATQPAAERHVQVKNINKEITKVEEEKSKIRTRTHPALPEGVLADSHEARLFHLRCRYDIRAKVVVKENEIAFLTEKRALISGITTANAAAERREFIKACPANDCRGFLSSAWKCGLCEMWACPDCHEIKGAERDVAHTCNPDVLATVRMLADDTRQCPKCPAMIFKIEGCFAKDTPVLIWDGTLKMSQDIQIGDILIGDDGQQRIVQHLLSGIDNMYEVSQKNGMTYTVNSKHKLALKFSGNKVIYWKESENAWCMRWFDHTINTMKSKKSKVTQEISREQSRTILEDFRKSISFPDVIEITIDEYMKLTPSCKAHLMGFKGVGIDYDYKEVKVDPYLLGLYIGDGINNGIAFAVCPQKDPEIIHYLLKWCNENNAELIHDEAYKFRIKRRGFGERLGIGRGAVSATCKGCLQNKCYLCDLPNIEYTNDNINSELNPLKEILQYYDLIKNKHIPNDFLMNSREVRLKVLAGIVDTDGYLGNDGKRIQIPQSNHLIAKQIEFLARSLGFVVNIDILQKKNVSFPNTEKKDYNDQMRVNISGEHLDEIPCLIIRKKCNSSRANKDYLRTSITVTHVGTDNYYGWSVDQNKRFLLSDFTVVRNCDQMYCTQCHTAFSWRTGRVETGTIHNPHYYDFMRQRNGGVAPRNPGDIPCGGLIRNSTIMNSLRTARIDENREIYMALMDYHRLHNHIQHVELPKYVVRRIAENEDLRIKFLVNEIDEVVFKLELQKREKAVEKKQEIHQILTMYQTVVMDLLNRTTTLATIEQFEGLNTELDEIRNYMNTQFITISKLYNCVVPNIVFEDIKVYRHQRRNYGAATPGSVSITEFDMKRTLMYKTQKY